MSKHVDSNELMCRFVFRKSHIDNRLGRVTSAVFMPPKDLKLSVFRVKDLNEQEIWDIGKKVGQVSQRNLIGKADLIVAEFLERDLEIHADNKPPRHANIVNWPIEEGKRLSIAQELADIARLTISN
jgi:hypothetical protein